MQRERMERTKSLELHLTEAEFSSVAFVHAASNARTITVLRSVGVLEDGMEHHAQALVALSISSALCLGAWIWARRRLDRFQARVDGHDRS
jgi:hypothetical protein